VPEWFAIAISPRVVRRGLKYAVIVGTILLSINHGAAILRGEVTSSRMLQMALTVLVPYCVSTLSSIEATREARRKSL
jgi:hypothetical protein